MCYHNASNYHLIDIVTLTDTQRGHMVFLTKLTDHGSSNLYLNDMHWFNMTESHKHYTLYYTTLHLEALQGSFCVCTQTIKACGVL